MLDKIKSLQKMELIKIQDAAIVTWPQGKDKPRPSSWVDMAGMGAMQGAFWACCFGLIFFVPFFGLAVGAAMGALSGKMPITVSVTKFHQNNREKVTEGTSALFLMTSDAVQDKVAAELKGYKFELIASNLTKEQEEQLMAAFSEE